MSTSSRAGRATTSLSGGNNLDKLDGGNGDDVLAGGGSSDQIIGGRGNDLLSGNQTDAVVYDNGLDTFLFVGKFGNDTITDFHIGFSTIAFVGGIDESDVTVKIKGDDVKIVVAHRHDSRRSSSRASRISSIPTSTSSTPDAGVGCSPACRSRRSRDRDRGIAT